jgi:hypothetical protein
VGNQNWDRLGQPKPRGRPEYSTSLTKVGNKYSTSLTNVSDTYFCSEKNETLLNGFLSNDRENKHKKK